MILGALIDAGLTLTRLKAALAALPLTGYRLSARSVRRAGFAGRKVSVALEKHRSHHSGEEHRGLREILSLINLSDLSDSVKEKAGRIFRRLAEAESRAHGASVETVHFHEVGAVDAIVDIVGTCAALELLAVERVHCSPLALGKGTVRCAHGVMPIPAPGTAALLKGVPVQEADVEGELTTPTGAAILSTLAESFGPMPAMTVQSVGVGAGSADRPERPNLLRVFVGETAGPTLEDHVAVIETNLDDMTPELCGALFERLIAAGALDVYVTPIVMKRGRPAVLVTVITPPEQCTALQTMLFEETTTFGVRVSFAHRQKLDRSWRKVSTPYGDVRVKVGALGGKVITISPEYEDCRKAAEERGVPIRKVYEAAQRAAGAP